MSDSLPSNAGAVAVAALREVVYRRCTDAELLRHWRDATAKIDTLWRELERRRLL